MTKREFLEKIVEMNIEEISEYAQTQIEKMDAVNQKRRDAEKKPSKTALENEAFVAQIVEGFLGDEPKTATEIGEFLEVSAQKASAIARQAVKSGLAKATDLKVKGRKVKGYTL